MNAVLGSIKKKPSAAPLPRPHSRLEPCKLGTIRRRQLSRLAPLSVAQRAPDAELPALISDSFFASAPLIPTPLGQSQPRDEN